jgi:predicted acylesterase/phospholipase RssA
MLITLGAPVQEMIDYFVQRPLNRVFQMNVTNTGIIPSSCFEELLIPFFHAYDTPITITLKELYDQTHIDLHIFTTAVTPMCPVDLNHTTFPDLQVLQAVVMSCAIPFLFTPIVYQGEYYVDGGLVKHCPIPEVDPDHVMVILMDYKHTMNLDSPLQFIQHVMMKLLDIVSSNTVIPEGRFVYRFNTSQNAMDPYLWEHVLSDSTYREQMIQMGNEFVKDRLNSGDKLPV